MLATKVRDRGSMKRDVAHKGSGSSLHRSVRSPTRLAIVAQLLAIELTRPTTRVRGPRQWRGHNNPSGAVSAARAVRLDRELVGGSPQVLHIALQHLARLPP